MNQKDNIGSLETVSSCLMSSYGLCAPSCPTLWESPDCSLPGSSVHGIPQASIVEWVAISSSRDLPNPEIVFPASLSLAEMLVFPASLSLAGGFFTTEPPEKPLMSSRKELKINFLPAESFSFGRECVLILGTQETIFPDV